MLNRSYTVSTRPRVHYRRVQRFRNLGDTFRNHSKSTCVQPAGAKSMCTSAVYASERALTCFLPSNEILGSASLLLWCVCAWRVCVRSCTIIASPPFTTIPSHRWSSLRTSSSPACLDAQTRGSCRTECALGTWAPAHRSFCFRYCSV